MSTDSGKHHHQPLEQWFWPTNSSSLSPFVGINNKYSSSTTLTSATSALNRSKRQRYRQWWKVCWVYSDGNLLYQRFNALKQQQQQQKQQSLQQSADNSPAIVDFQCHNRDDFFAASTKLNKSFSQEKHSIETIMQHSSNYFHHQQQSSSFSSNFLPQKLAQPFNMLLKQKTENNGISQFFIQYKGANWRSEQLQYQVPFQDTQILKQQSNEARFVKSQQRKSQIKPFLFCNKLTSLCNKCNATIESGSYGVKISLPCLGNSNGGYNTTTEDEDNQVVLRNDSSDGLQANENILIYHVDCFTCATCQQVMVDFKAFFHHNSKNNIANSLYCFRHFIELFKPRCQYCDILIFEEECTEAEGKTWHIGHFCCTECRRSLGGQQYIMADPSKRNEDKKRPETRQEIVSTINKLPNQLPYCLTCFDILFGELCEECGELISCDAGSISHEGRSWHAKTDCFRCNNCLNPLLGKPFLPACDGKIYCSYSCSQITFQKSYHGQRKRRDKQKIDTIKPRGNQNDSCSDSPIKTKNLNDDLMSTIKISDSNDEVYRNESTEKLNDSTHLNRREILHKQNQHQNDSVKIKSFKEFCENKMLGQFEGSCQEEAASDRGEAQQMLQLDNMPQILLEYMKCQLQLQQMQQFQNGVVGATLEYGSSLSEEEPANALVQQDHSRVDVSQKVDLLTDINSNQATSSSSSSRNVTPSHLPERNTLMTLKQHSSSSNETTPLLTRPNQPVIKHPTRAPQSDRLPTSDFQLSDANPKKQPPDNYKKACLLQDCVAQISPGSSHSLGSSSKKEQSNEESIVDTPSTQSTAIHSTSPQTTPEVEQRSPSKSVSFDPSVKEPTGRVPIRKNRKSNQRKNLEHKYWSDDSSSSSSCSTCSSSSEDYYDYDSTLTSYKNQWYGGTRIQYVTNDRKKQREECDSKHNTNTSGNNDSCSIS